MEIISLLIGTRILHQEHIYILSSAFNLANFNFF